MASTATAPRTEAPNTRNRFKPFSGFIQSTPSNSSPCLTLKTPPSSASSSFKVLFPLFFPDSSPHRPLYIPLASWPSQFESAQPDSPLSSTDPVTPSSSSPAFKNMNSKSATGFPSAVKVPGLKFNRDQAGPAFVDQVFSMSDSPAAKVVSIQRGRSHVSSAFSNAIDIEGDEGSVQETKEDSGACRQVLGLSFRDIRS